MNEIVLLPAIRRDRRSVNGSARINKPARLMTRASDGKRIRQTVSGGDSAVALAAATAKLLDKLRNYEEPR